VIFSDVSRSLLEHCRSLAAQLAVSERCEFLEARAEDLRPVADDTVDAVTTRSVLIYVADKASAFREFHRVLKRSGQISLFEPINRYGLDTWRFDVGPVLDLAQRLRDFYQRLQPPDSDPMLDFDEHRLVALCEAGGLRGHPSRAAHLRAAGHTPAVGPGDLDPGEPEHPSPREAMTQVFTPEEATRYEAHVRPRVEAGHGVVREAVAYLAATKPERLAPTLPGRDGP
jgi:arsenite methyltransferase